MFEFLACEFLGGRTVPSELCNDLVCSLDCLSSRNKEPAS